MNQTRKEIREELGLIRDAIGGKWDVPDEARREMPDKLYAIVKGRGRHAVRAAELLIEMVRQNNELALEVDPNRVRIVIVPESEPTP